MFPDRYLQAAVLPQSVRTGVQQLDWRFDGMPSLGCAGGDHGGRLLPSRRQPVTAEANAEWMAADTSGACTAASVRTVTSDACSIARRTPSVDS